MQLRNAIIQVWLIPDKIVLAKKSFIYLKMEIAKDVHNFISLIAQALQNLLAYMDFLKQ